MCGERSERERSVSFISIRDDFLTSCGFAEELMTAQVKEERSEKVLKLSRRLKIETVKEKERKNFSLFL